MNAFSDAALTRRSFALASFAIAATPRLLLAAQAPGAPAMSIAEHQLFADHHLRNVRPPTTLRYGYIKTGSLEPGVRDEVQLMLRPARDGSCCVATGNFLDAQHGVALPEIDDARANPVVLYFLEHEVREMHRRTQGQPNYFRKRIRLSLADAATIKDTQIRFQGRELPAQEVRIEPYADDPMRARYQRFAAKQYIFVIAAAVPGGVYQMRTVLPGAQSDAAPLLEEALTLEDATADKQLQTATQPDR
ncbi:hypothetical protein [Piscinibacter sp.]|jgi:hypothetical protein|uniref:hypothetical protein n=1 Tax=Piscinibacter sp. TaxID=1903157 RepID=UPI002F3FE4B2